MDIGTRGRGTLAGATVAAALLCMASTAPAGTPVALPALPPTPQLQPPPQLPSVPQLPSTPQSPSLPSPPPVQLPDLPQLPAPPSAPSVPDAPGAIERTSGSGGSSDGGGSAGGSLPSQGGSDGSAGSGSAGDTGSKRRGSRTRAGRRAERRQIAERRLRRSVRENRGCLSSLTNFQQQVLEMRAGVDGQAPQSRNGVAQRLDVPVDSVAHAESRGLVSLRGAAGSGGCGMAGTPGSLGSIPPLLPLLLAAPMPELTKLASISPDSDAQADGTGAVLGDTVSSEDSGSESGAGGEPVAARVATGTDDGLSALPLFLIALLVLAGLGAYAVLPLGRSRRGGEATTGAAGMAAASGAVADRPFRPAPPANAPVIEPTPPWLAEPFPETETSPEAERSPETEPSPRTESSSEAEPFAGPKSPFGPESPFEPAAREEPSYPAPAQTDATPTPRSQAQKRIAGAAGIAASAVASVVTRALVQRRSSRRRRRRR